jgi:hypothetical protein
MKVCLATYTSRLISTQLGTGESYKYLLGVWKSHEKRHGEGHNLLRGVSEFRSLICSFFFPNFVCDVRYNPVQRL